jgi:ribosomal protein L11 methyltransferase
VAWDVAWAKARVGTFVKQLKALVPVRLATPVTTIVSEAGVAAVDTSAQPDEEGRVWVTAYCEDAETLALRKRCQAELAKLARRMGVAPVPKFEIEAVRADWATSWTLVLPPARLAPGLVLIAEGVDYEAVEGERVLRLEAGLYFGFGEHPTTQLISGWITEFCPQRRVLDVGCGTGVLAFVAAFARATSVFGVDIDVPSVESAQRNAAKNGLNELCEFSGDALETVSGQYEVVLANIDAKTLTLLAGQLCRVLAAGGLVALTGVLEEQAAGVVEAFGRAGVAVRVIAEREGWVLLTNTPAVAQLNGRNA